MTRAFSIGDRHIGEGYPCFIIAEISGNHHQKYEEAEQLVRAAHEAGADAVKLQTYTADTITLDSDKEYFFVGGKDQPDTWKKRTLYELYTQAHTPWEWQPKLKKLADELGLILFSSAFDDSSVDFLETMGVVVYKVASYEVVHIPLLRRIARTMKPVIMSTGFASQEEIALAVRTLREAGSGTVALLHCVTAYSDAPQMSEMHLATIRDMRERYDAVAGFSDNNAGILAPVIAAHAAGASLVEKHLTLSRALGGPDSCFSLEPHELKDMIARIRRGENEGGESAITGIGTKQDISAAQGSVHYGPASERERENIFFRPSLWVKKAMQKGEIFTMENVRVARPNHGLPPKDLEIVLGKKAAVDIEAATPLRLDLIA
ncbi:MAG: pseudaminic acid synthase [bacterium]|nr:pseudaminic acid synthase [bacterium]